MSHDSKVALEGMSDLDTLEAALTDLGIEVERNGTRRGYRGVRTNHALVAKLDGYDVGFDVKGGVIESTQDQWGINVRAYEGGFKKFQKDIRTAYTVSTVKRQMASNRKVVGRKQTTTADGKIQLRFRVR